LKEGMGGVERVHRVEQSAAHEGKGTARAHRRGSCEGGRRGGLDPKDAGGRRGRFRTEGL
jgi:hypothetical protein